MKKRLYLFDQCDDRREKLENLRCAAAVLPHSDYIVIESFGLWYSRISDYRAFKAAKEIFSFNENEYCNDWFIENGDLKSSRIQYDSMKYHVYRIWKNGLSRRQKHNFIEKIMNGTYTKKDVSRYTVSVVPELEKAGII